MTTRSIFTVSPSTNKVIHETVETSLDDAKRIATASAQAFSSYRKLPLSQRKAIVTKAIDLIQQNKGELSKDLTAQMGRPISYSPKEIETLKMRAEFFLKEVDSALKDIPTSHEAGFRRFVKKVPIGPVLAIFAWNYPYLILFSTLLPALLAGNSIILKPSPQTPRIATRVRELFIEAGLPKDVIQVVQSGNPEVVKEIVQIPGINLVTFVGSTEGGRQIRAAVANRIIPVNLELGGNDPAYVRADCDIPNVAAALVDGAVFNSGQSCCAIERIYVHKDIHDAFVAAMQDELKRYTLGDPFHTSTMVGPVISKAAVNKINAQVEDAILKGAKDVTPYNESFENPPKEGNYVAPRLLTNVTHVMQVMRDETFGPIIPVMSVKSDEEAIELMNQSEYGLTASVWTKDIQAGENIIERLEAGTVFINKCDAPHVELAWTGWKDSGLGSTMGPHAFDAFVKLQSYHIKESLTE